jgi:sugar lactone lactonase YvrE
VTSPSITVVPVPGPGAEDVVVATHGPDEGAVFTGTEDGAIWRVTHDAARVDRVAETSGRPLGIEIDLDGRLLVCDADRGLLRVDTRTGGVEAVADSVDGVPMLVCNNAAIARDGTV